MAVCMAASGYLVATAETSLAATDTSASPLQLANAIAEDPSVVSGANYVAVPPTGSPNAVVTTPLAGFPTAGGSYALLTTGDANLADQPNDSPSSGVDDGGGNVRGNTDYDVTILKIDLDVPNGVNCLLGMNFRFLSEEYPEYVGTQYNDAFIAELDKATWTTSGSTISAPDNFAFDPSGNPITINAAGVTSMNGANASGTTYDGATPLLSAATPITPGAHSLYLSIFDQGDSVYDSAVMVDDLRLGTVANVATDCKPGATVASQPLTVTMSTADYPITPDPNTAAYVGLTVKATYPDGTPAVNAAVKMSNAVPTATFHTNAAGELHLVEPVDVTESLTKTLTATVTATDGATGSASHTLYSANEQVSCSFQGRPGLDTGLLKDMLPDPASTIAEIVEGLMQAASKVHTNAVGYRVDVPSSGSFYAQTVLITKNGSTTYNGAGYSYSQILRPPKGWLESQQTGCVATSGPA